MKTIWEGRTIMIVDDEPDLREVLALDFQDLGCKTIEAKSGNQAFELLQKHTVDAIISDIRMPDGNGVDLLEKVRKLHPSTPVMCLVTAYADINEEEARRRGATALFPKPFDRKELITALERALANIK